MTMLLLLCLCLLVDNAIAAHSKVKASGLTTQQDKVKDGTLMKKNAVFLSIDNFLDMEPNSVVLDMVKKLRVNMPLRFDFYKVGKERKIIVYLNDKDSEVYDPNNHDVDPSLKDNIKSFPEKKKTYSYEVEDNEPGIEFITSNRYHRLNSNRATKQALVYTFVKDGGVTSSEAWKIAEIEELDRSSRIKLKTDSTTFSISNESIDDYYVKVYYQTFKISKSKLENRVVAADLVVDVKYYFSRTLQLGVWRTDRVSIPIEDVVLAGTPTPTLQSLLESLQ